MQKGLKRAERKTAREENIFLNNQVQDVKIKFEAQIATRNNLGLHKKKNKTSSKTIRFFRKILGP